MFRPSLLALVLGLVVLSNGHGQEPKKAATKPDDTKDAPKDAPAVKYKGILPMNWKKLGLSEAQVQDIYKVQGKYNSEIDKLEEKIAELKSTRDKEMKALLTPEQKKRLEDILLGRDK